MTQEELNSFFAVAEDLRVKGLTQNQSGSHGSKKTNQSATPAVEFLNSISQTRSWLLECRAATQGSHIPRFVMPMALINEFNVFRVIIKSGSAILLN